MGNTNINTAVNQLGTTLHRILITLAKKCACSNSFSTLLDILQQNVEQVRNRQKLLMVQTNFFSSLITQRFNP